MGNSGLKSIPISRRGSRVTITAVILINYYFLPQVQTYIAIFELVRYNYVSPLSVIEKRKKTCQEHHCKESITDTSNQIDFILSDKTLSTHLGKISDRTKVSK